MLTLASLFDGIVPLWASEIEKAPISITKRHFPDMEHLGDITRLHGGEVPPVDIITFGSPCQNLSSAGRREGLGGAKSSLFFQAVRLIEEMRDATGGQFPTIVRSKYITFGVPADGLETARPRLERVSSDIMGNFKKLGAHSHVLNGRERLEVLHGQMHPGGREPFRFSWPDIVKTGMGTKDFIAPDSFDFSASRTFRVGQSWGAASYLQIMASELSDKLLLELLELDAEMTVTLHVQTVDQLKAIKMTKGKISDIDKMKVEEQKKAVRAGYDMEILPPDLITYSKDAAALLADLQSRNERMFLLTFTVVNIAPTRQKLENDVFTISGIAQKYNCALKRLDWQQEQGFTSSLVLGDNAIEIQRGMTTSSTAIFVPFMTKELRMDGAALYYGMNALSNNVIMADRKRLKNPKGVYRKGTGTPRKQQAVRPQAAQGRGKGRAMVILTVVYHRQPNMERGLIPCRQ